MKPFLCRRWRDGWKLKRAVIQWVSNIYTCCCRTQWEAAQCESQTTAADRPNKSSTCTNHPVDFSWLHLRSTDCLWKSSALEAGCGFPYWPRGTVLHQHWAPWILSTRGHSHGTMWPLGIFHWLINPCGAAGPGWDKPPPPLPADETHWLDVGLSSYQSVTANEGHYRPQRGAEKRRDGRCNMEGEGLLNTTAEASGGRWSARRRASLCQAIPLLINIPALLFNAKTHHILSVE